MIVINNREWQYQLSTMFWPCLEQITFWPNCGANGSHNFFANCVKRWVCDLCKHLLKIIEQQTRACRQHRNWRICSHRPKWFSTALRHWRQNDFEFFVRVTKNLLAPQHAVAAEHHVLSCWQVTQFYKSRIEPFLIGSD